MNDPHLNIRTILSDPQVEDAGVEEGLPGALAAAIRPAALAEYERTLTAVFSAGAEASGYPSL